MGISHIEGEIKNIEMETLSMEEMSLSSDEIWRYTWLRPLQNRHNALLRQKKQLIGQRELKNSGWAEVIKIQAFSTTQSKFATTKIEWKPSKILLLISLLSRLVFKIILFSFTKNFALFLLISILILCLMLCRMISLLLTMKKSGFDKSYLQNWSLSNT